VKKTAVATLVTQHNLIANPLDAWPPDLAQLITWCGSTP